VSSLLFSFSSIELDGFGFKRIFIGFENFRQVLFVNPTFSRTVITSMGSMLLSVPTVLIFSLFVATLLNTKIKGKVLFRAIFFLPVILGTGIIIKADIGNSIMSGVWNNQLEVSDAAAGTMLNADDVRNFLLNVKLSPQLSSYIVSAVDNIYNVVNNSGVQILIFLAGLQSISPSIYESAQIEGATGWESFWKITFPMISPLIFMNMIYTIIDSFTNPQNSIIIMIENLIYKEPKFGVASAMAWIYFVLSGIIISLAALLFGRFVFYQTRQGGTK